MLESVVVWAWDQQMTQQAGGVWWPTAAGGDCTAAGAGYGVLATSYCRWHPHG